MSDQCRNCTLRGDYETCINTECFHHENWINVVRINKIKALERQLEEALEYLHHPSLGDYLREVIKLNFEDVKRTDCCTKTAEWILEKIEQWDKGDEETPT